MKGQLYLEGGGSRPYGTYVREAEGSLQIVQTNKGRVGVKNPEIFAYVINGSP